MAEVTRITIGFILGWILGVGALITGVSQLGISPVRGIFTLLIAAILIPPASKFLETKSKISLSGGVKVLVVVVLAIIAGAVDSTNSASSPAPLTSGIPQQSQSVAKTSSSVNTPAVVIPPHAASYQKIFTFSGNGAKKSEPFTITGSRFKIKYDCKGGLCQAFLKKTDAEWDIKLVMNTTESTKDESVFYGAGEYYIDANTMGSYTMTVEDYK